METNIKMIFFDLDGTLLSRNQQMSEATIKALEEVRGRGIKITLCTGRMPAMLKVFVSQLKLDIPYAACNGSIIIDPLTDNIIYKCPIEKKLAIDFINYCYENNLDFTALALEKCYFLKEKERIKRFRGYNALAESLGQPLFNYEIINDNPLPNFENIDVFKIAISEEMPGENNKAIEYLKTLGNVSYSYSGLGLLEAYSPKISKGTGVTQIAKQFGLEPSQVCVFGDYENDLSMFNVARISVAMGNSIEEVKKASTFITLPNYEDGVAYAVNKLFLD